MNFQKIIIEDTVNIPAKFKYIRQDVFAFDGTRFNIAYVYGKFEDEPETVFQDYIYAREKHVLQKISLEKTGSNAGYIIYSVKSEILIPAGIEDFKENLWPVMLKHDLSSITELPYKRRSISLQKEGVFEPKVVVYTYEDAKDIQVPVVIKVEMTELIDDTNPGTPKPGLQSSTITLPPNPNNAISDDDIVQTGGGNQNDDFVEIIDE